MGGIAYNLANPEARELKRKNDAWLRKAKQDARKQQRKLASKRPVARKKKGPQTGLPEYF